MGGWERVECACADRQRVACNHLTALVVHLAAAGSIPRMLPNAHAWRMMIAVRRMNERMGGWAGGGRHGSTAQSRQADDAGTPPTHTTVHSTTTMRWRNAANNPLRLAALTHDDDGWATAASVTPTPGGSVAPPMLVHGVSDALHALCRLGIAFHRHHSPPPRRPPLDSSAVLVSDRG